MKTDKNYIRQVIWSAIITNLDNENCRLEDITDDLDFVNRYEIPSVSIVAVISQFEEEYNTELKISDIYRLRSVNEIAEYIDNSAKTEEKIAAEKMQSPVKSINDIFDEL